MKIKNTMKKTVATTIAFLMACGIASAIEMSWGVHILYLDGELANTTTYGTTPGSQHLLQLVYVGDKSMTNGEFNTIEPVDRAYLSEIQDGNVYGLGTEVNRVGWYIIMLYDNDGKHYVISDTLGGAVLPSSMVEVTQDGLIGIDTYDVIGPPEDVPAYKGALVPEPGTSALAIAGIALLIRRRS